MDETSNTIPKIRSFPERLALPCATASSLKKLQPASNISAAITKRPTGTLLEYSENVSSLFSKLYELDDEISKTVLIEELHGSERVKLTLCDVWGEGLLDYPKAKTKVIKITAKDYVFIDLKDNLNKLSD